MLHYIHNNFSFYNFFFPLQGQVCESCGVVVEGIQLNNEISRTPYTSIIPRTRNKFERCLKKTKPVPAALTHGLDCLKNLWHIFQIPQNREDEAANILKSAYKAKRFKRKEDFAVLAGCCLYLFQKKHEFISLKEICAQLQCTRKKFSKMLNFLKSWASSKNIDWSASGNEGWFSNGHLISDDEEEDIDLPTAAKYLIHVVCAKAPEAEKKLLLKKTGDLLKLANSCWLFTGRSPHSVVVACAFLCWKSMHLHQKRTSFSRFCSDFGIREPVAKVRIPELKELLLKLGRKIPSCTPNYVNESNLLFHLDTILDNSETFRNDLLADEFSEEAVNSKEFSTFRIPVKNPPRKIANTAITYPEDMNASDIEISDSEIESYIRKETQTQYIRNLKENKC